MPWYQRYMSDMPWHKIFEDDARKMLGHHIDDWENCCADAKERLFFHKLPNAKLAHTGNKDGFVRAAYKNILRDIMREYAGRPRAPQNMVREGDKIEKIFKLHCLQQMPNEDISHSLGLPYDVVKKWTTWLKANQKCPKDIAFVGITQSGDSGDYDLPLTDSDSPDPVCEEIVSAEITQLMSIILGSDRSDEQFSTVMKETLQKLRATLTLTDEERLILKLRFEEDLSITAAAKALNMARATFERRYTRLMDKLRDSLQ